MIQECTCRSCNQKILWVQTEARPHKPSKPMPLDPVPTEKGNVIIIMGDKAEAHTETMDERAARLKATEPAARVAYMSHHATCPQGRRWRR